MKPRHMNRMIALLLLAGTALLGQGSAIKAKAWLAQQLIAATWDQRSPGSLPAKPWPWADTRVVARLSVPTLGVVQYVMADASGESLAFGPGAVLFDTVLGAAGASVIAGHRDTHFRFLEYIAPGTRIEVDNYLGGRRSYVVRQREVVDSTTETLSVDPDRTSLTLVTCWPFDTVVPGGPMRYLVRAEPMVPRVSGEGVELGERIAWLRDHQS